MTIQVDDEITLAILDEEHAEETFDLINNNRDHLREWLPWVDSMKNIENFKAYIINSRHLYEDGTDLGYVILYNSKIAGRIGLHHINRANRLGAIGYWLGESFAGKGIITRSCQALIRHGFTKINLNRIEIKCGTGNHKSKAIAERLKFKQEGILHQAECVNGNFIDLFLFAMLREEWQNT
jgi:ribosomal-protein-serine acetyltransferase